MAFHQFLQTQTGQILHDVIKGAIGGMAIVIDFDGVPVSQGRHGLHFALEARQVGGIAGLVGTNQLDSAGPAQQYMFAKIDFPHSARAQFTGQAVLP